MILTHGGNSVNVGGNDILFYTDFSSYSNLIDTPQIGEYAKYVNSSIYISDIYSTGGPFNKKYMKLNTGQWSLLEKNYQPIRLSNLVTLEFWAKSLYPQGAYIYCDNIFVFILNRLVHLQVGTGYTCNVYNNTHFHTNTDTMKVIYTTDSTDNFVHIAIVNNKGNFKFYTNGVIRAEFNRNTEMQLTGSIGIQGNQDNIATYLAYLSLRDGDWSTGNSFPVPTKPYL